jgi:hypothetical protein
MRARSFPNKEIGLQCLQRSHIYENEVDCMVTNA